MKLYRQGNNEIRITLTKEDLDAYSITVEDFDYDSTHGKRVIWELFDKARRETGFDASGEKIYIQLLPSETGGCELFVTKIEKEEEIRDCFFFSDFDCLFTALSHTVSMPDGATLWKDGRKGHFYALIPENKTPPVFYEFGEKVKTPSSIFLHSRCRKVHWEERQSHDGK